MMPVAFRTRRLAGEQLSKAYTLVQIACGDRDAETWYRFAMAYSEQQPDNCDPCGVVGVEDTRGYILGLFCFRVMRETPFGALFECDHFVVPDLVRSIRPFAVLTQAAEALAREHNCGRLRLALPEADRLAVRPAGQSADRPAARPADRFRDALYEAGFTLDSIRFEKRIDGPGSIPLARIS